VCVLVQFLSSGKVVRLGLVVEGGGRVPLGVVLHTQVFLIDWKGRAPVDQGAPKKEWHCWELSDSAYSIQIV
jgi:hypothetical protein